MPVEGRAKADARHPVDTLQHPYNLFIDSESVRPYCCPQQETHVGFQNSLESQYAA